VIGLSILAGLFSATPASASEEGRRNTALALGAVTGYLFTRGGSKVPAFAGLAATAYAAKKYNDSVKDRHRREQYYGRYDDYNGSRFDRGRYDNYNDGRRYDDGGRRYYRHDNGNHNGWYKNKHKNKHGRGHGHQDCDDD
jgi:hypothetical protein